jgi:hypothetical protein
MERVKIKSKSDDEIVFASVNDLQKFWDEVSNGKTILLEWEKDGYLHGELLNPNNAPQINDGKVKLKSIQSK